MDGHGQQIMQASIRHMLYRCSLIGIIVILFALMVYALFNQFIPSSWWFTLGMNINVVITALLSVMYFAMLRKQGDSLTYLYQKYYKWMVYVSGPCIFYFLGYIGIIYELGDLLHQTANQPHIIEEVVHKEFIDTRKGCKTRLVGEYLKDAMPPNICVSQMDFDQLPPNIAMELIGEISHFGFHVEHYAYDWEKTSTLNTVSGVRHAM